MLTAINQHAIILLQFNVLFHRKEVVYNDEKTRLVRSIVCVTLTLLLVSVMCYSTVNKVYGSEDNEESKSVYAITPEDERWKELNTTQDKIDACRINQ